MLEDRCDLKGEPYAAHSELLVQAVLNALEALPRLVSAYLDILGESAWLEPKTAFSPFVMVGKIW